MTDSPEVRPQPNWRDPTSYNYTRNLNRESWVWEFLRRNPAYRKDWDHNPKAQVEDRQSAAKIRILSRPAMPPSIAHWGLLFFSDPAERNADVFWHPDVHPAVLSVHASLASRRDPDTFDIEDFTHPVTVLRLSSQTQHVLLNDGAHHIQLAVQGSVLEGPVRLHYQLTGCAGIEPKLVTIQRLLALQRLGRIPQSLRAPERRTNRWTFALRTIDALEAGASHRQIASALWGGDAVRRDWRGTSDYLRSRVRRIIHIGETIADGGYIHLLRRNSYVR